MEDLRIAVSINASYYFAMYIQLTPQVLQTLLDVTSVHCGVELSQ